MRECRLLYCLLPALLGVAWVSPLAAQLPGTCSAAASADSLARPTVAIFASVHAREVRFQSEPKLSARFTGCAALDSVRVLERRNLPNPVQPGVTYRDVTVSVELLGHLHAACLLTALADSLCAAAKPDSAANATSRRSKQ
ncbi:MAG TPA: hypothetical protein VFI96_02170 [Longimicrobiaceae bacterium]|nr:hypothetical protein [Longimicrobiaceae bacterium]